MRTLLVGPLAALFVLATLLPGPSFGTFRAHDGNSGKGSASEDQGNGDDDGRPDDDDDDNQCDDDDSCNAPPDCQAARCAVRAELDERCPCDQSNHGKYVSCIARASKKLEK